LHTILRGGWLDMHVDFNAHPRLGRRRALNLLLYLNEDAAGLGGELTLSYRGSRSELSIDPSWNRLVIFGCDDAHFHGHPVPWRGTEPRRSLAVYYYAEPFVGEAHSTIWR
jgi:Rps23 Pro-64 3,4-dihydroxylase Tpa1-like proline 4-hydroxylase